MLPDPTLKYRERGQGTRASTTCAIGISELCDNYITVVGSMLIIIHVHQWLLNLRCALAVATRYCEVAKEKYEKCLVISVEQATITETFPTSRY